MIEHPGKEIWVKELSSGDWAVCLFNPTGQPSKMRIKWPQFWVLDSKTEYEVRDIWPQKDLGTTQTKNDFFVTIEPHDVIVYRLNKTQKDDHETEKK